MTNGHAHHHEEPRGGLSSRVVMWGAVAIIAFVFVKLFGTAAPGGDGGGRR